MHLISQKVLRDFWNNHPDAEIPLRAWLQVVERAGWQKFSDVREVYSSADLFGRCVVFNIGGNKFRLITAIHFNREKVYVRHVLTHTEYDKGRWKKGCCGEQASTKTKSKRVGEGKTKRAQKKR